MKIKQKQQINTDTKMGYVAPVVWGVNKFGQKVKEHDKLSCGNGHDNWFTHVMFDVERNCWHREQDYYHGKAVGSYNGC
jgi:hypothetical protein